MTGEAGTSGAGVVIVGAGHGGVTAAIELRAKGYAGPVTLLSDEPVAPYERPPLSKAWLTAPDGAPPPLYDADTLAERGIALRLGARAEAVDTGARTVTVGGAMLPYDHLILATGAAARRLPLPGCDAEGVHTLRTAADAERLKAALGEGVRLVVVGAGYIGLEVAASARKRGADVTVAELSDRPMARTASVEVAAFFQAAHEARGVRFVFGDGLAAIETEDARARGVRLASGRVLPADAVLLAAGGVPDCALATAAGLDCDDGIVVDEAARTSAPGVYAVGDATRRPSAFAHAPIRLESVHNALEQARLAAADVAGAPPPRVEAPWFWSDQYDLKLQIAGLVGDADRRIVREGPGALSVFHLRGGALRAVEAVNDPRAYMTGRTALTRGLAVDVGVLADPEADLKDALAR